MDRRTQWPAAPVVFQQPPDLPGLIQAVNNNSSRVRQLSVSRGRLRVNGFSLRAELYFEQPRRFRLFAETTLTGRELDLGSNDERYWMWGKSLKPPAVLHGRHDQFEQSLARQILPVSPDWLAQAVGLVYIDPVGVHEGPIPLSPDVVQIRTRLPSSQGELLRHLDIDARRGLVLAQRLYDIRGVEVASAVASEFRFDPLQGVSLPGRVEISLPTAPDPLAFTFEADSYTINQPIADPASMWAMPDLSNSGYDYFDVANPADMRKLFPDLARAPAPPNDVARFAPPPAAAFDPYQDGQFAGPTYGAPPNTSPAAVPPTATVPTNGISERGIVTRLPAPNTVSPWDSRYAEPPRAALRRLPSFSAIR